MIGPEESGDQRAYSVFFLDETTGFLNRNSRLYRTSDGGQTWQNVVAQVGYYAPIKFADPEVGWAFQGAAGQFGQSLWCWTTDGGKRWTSRSIPFPATAQAFSLPRRDRAYVVGNHGMIYRYRVVPAAEEVAKSIPAPVMPSVDAGLAEQTTQLETQVEALEEKAKEELKLDVAEPTAAAESKPTEAKPEAGAGEAAGQPLLDACCKEEVAQVEALINSVDTEVPKFTGKLRNLNLIFTGLKLVGELFGQARSMKQSIKNLRGARDPQSVSAALAELTTQVQGMVSSTKTALGTAAAPVPQQE